MKPLKYLLFSILLIHFAGISSCSNNLPEPNDKTSAILIIPVVLENTSDHPFGFSVTYEIADCIQNGRKIEFQYTGRIWPRSNPKFVVIDELPPATCMLTDIKLYYYDRPTGKSSLKRESIDLEIELRKEEIYIFPRALKIVQVNSGKGNYKFSYYFEETQKAEMFAILNYLKSQENFEKWRIRENKIF